MKTEIEITEKLKEIELDLDLHLSCEWAIDSKETKILSIMTKNSMKKQIDLLKWVLNEAIVSE